MSHANTTTLNDLEDTFCLKHILYCDIELHLPTLKKARLGYVLRTCVDENCSNLARSARLNSNKNVTNLQKDSQYCATFLF